MDASLTPRRRVGDEGLRVVNSCVGHTCAQKKAPANSVPEASVMRRVQALSGFTGCKESVGGLMRLVLKARAHLE